jgi:dTDP-4-amino-4,6-dideoxygalactose transaminase
MKQSLALQRAQVAPREPVRHSCPAIGEGEIEAVTRVLRSGQLAQGGEVTAFEEELAAFVGRKYAVALSNGTAALELALRAVGAAYVAMPSYACAALTTAIHRSGGTPVICDVDDDGQLDPARVPSNVDCAIVPHLFGAVAALPATGIVIEDIAQSIGGPTGTRGAVAVASFYATKLMTTGEGGALLTDDEGIAGYARDQRDYDNRDDYEPRHNAKLTEFQAALGRIQLRRLPEFVERRRAIAAQYDEAFATLPIRLPAGTNHVYFRYVIRTPVRSALESFLNAEDIEAKRPVYKPAHQFFLLTRGPQPVELHGDFANSEAMHDTALSLPVHPSLRDEEVRYVIDTVKRFFG